MILPVKQNYEVKSMSNVLLKMENIIKIYENGIIANQGITFTVNKGEIHALMGENGAGKSTLMKILYGIEKPNEGDIIIHGRKVVFNSPNDAIKNKIGMVSQKLMLVPSLSIAENIVLGQEPANGEIINKKKFIKIANNLAEKFMFDIDTSQIVQDLSIANKQKVEILKALYRNVDILILDEPTAVLTPQETKELFAQLKLLKEHGHTIIFISHKLNEVKQICDRLTIMRHAKSTGTYEVKELSEQQISKLMVGRDVILKIDKSPAKPKKTVLKLRNLKVRNIEGKNLVNNISFDVRKGEILGIAGVEGNGQSEVVNAITGFEKDFLGDIYVKDISIKNKNVKQIRELGVAFIPADRQKDGIAADLSIKENLIANRLNQKNITKAGIINEKVINNLVNDLVDKYNVKCDSADQEVGMLSGGNIQKVIVAKELSLNADLIIADQPTRGIDVGAAEFVRKKLVELRDEGAAILLVSADLNEVFELCDSLIVMYKGEIVAYYEKLEDLTEIELGQYMLGIKKQTDIGGAIHEE